MDEIVGDHDEPLIASDNGLEDLSIPTTTVVGSSSSTMLDVSEKSDPSISSSTIMLDASGRITCSLFWFNSLRRVSCPIS